ncbi:MAG: patatin family protein [Oscillospiraceae bacterium]|jgi:predicted patatin/cPLA2 family phospholipase|nr:patatin family protein [Oscillospiraceae bacterium]
MKTGLVVEGGGMRGIYGAGVLDAFLDAGLKFEYSVGTSAGAANVISFAAGQRGRNYRFYAEHPKNPEYMGLRNVVRHGNYFNFDYIYGQLTLQDDPCDFDVLAAYPYEAEFVAAEAYTASPHYFTKDDLSPLDCSALTASCAVPGYCKPVRVDGGLYFDGGVVDSIPVARAIAKGCDRVVVVLSRSRGYRKAEQNHKAVYRFSLRRFPRMVTAVANRHENYNRTITFIDALELQGKAIVVAPSREVPVSLVCQDKALIDEFYRVGLEDGKRAARKIMREGKLALA